MFTIGRYAKAVCFWVLLSFVCARVWADVRYEGLEHLSSSRASWFREVVGRVVAAVPRFPHPLVVRVAQAEEPNAFAFVEEEEKGGRVANVVVTTRMLEEVVQDDPNRLAFVVGHELGHILLGHCTTPRNRQQPRFVQAVFSRQQELDADRKGAELLLAAGYTLRGTLKALYTRMADLGFNYSSFEGTGVDHPAWTERAEHLDKEQASLWRAMSAFQNGVLFLAVEQYAAAERSFERVTREFPSCYEAWSNLGYACLMQYFDALEPEDLRSFPVGYIVCGGFYTRPQSLEARVRGINEEMWWKAVGALNEALRLKPDLVLAKANLATAYLLRPSGADVGRAARLFQEALEAVERDRSLGAMERAVVLLNASSVDIARGDVKAGMERLSRVERILSGFIQPVAARSVSAPVQHALFYNQAMLLARSSERSERVRAFRLLEEYLKRAPASSLWWSLAYEQYRRMGQELEKPVATRQELQREQVPAFRLMTSVEARPGVLVSVGEPLAEAEKRLGQGERMRAVPDTNLMRIRYRQLGIDLIGAQQLLAIVLTREGATLPLREQGAGGKTVTLRVGMTEAEVERVLGDMRYDYRQMLERSVYYRFYPRIGVGLRVEGGRVVEIVVAQIPERPILG